MFVSSSPDLAAEREAIGQAVAELPISLGWEIKHTSRTEKNVHEPLAFIARCDLCLVVLGADFAAPMGLEWQQMLGTGKPLRTYRKRVLRSPSAQNLLRRSNVDWAEFESPHEFKAQVIRALAQTLLNHGEQFGLCVDDVERLLALIKAEQEEIPAEPDRRRGAGRGGVILHRGT